ncbi:MAG: helix-turn-helix domain-containing protein, partial [Ruthenibacterium sp.]
YLERLFAILREQDETRQTAELIDRVKNYIQEHFAENLTLTVLSELFYICPAYLSRLFKKKTGVNFVEYLTNLRITKGKEFLADSSLMIYTVSEMVGYENPRYFSRLFKESVGCSPQEYRNKLQ